jgi:hypothetical protein
MTTQSISTSQIIFIDGALDDIDTILAGLAPGMEVIILDPLQDGLLNWRRSISFRTARRARCNWVPPPSTATTWPSTRRNSAPSARRWRRPVT